MCSYICNLFIITPLIYPLHLNPPLNQPTPSNLSLIFPISHLNNSRSVLQYTKNTISTLHLFFNVTTQ